MMRWLKNHSAMADEYDKLKNTLEELQNVVSPFTDNDWKKIKPHLESLEKRKNKRPKMSKPREKATINLAYIIVIGYFIILLLVMIYAPIYDWFMVKYVIQKGVTYEALNVTNTFTMANSALVGIVGVAIGHFFNVKDKES
jgi:polyferredoxin